MDNQASKDLFKQVRIAYRLSASYYKRIHQLIRDVTSDEQLGLEYFIWGPAEFSYINGRNAKVLDYYSWNLLPGGITHYLFINGSKDIPQIPGEWMLAMYFISDTAVFDEVMQDNLDLDASEIKTSVDEAKSVLRCYLVAPQQELDLYWADGIWNPLDYPECTQAPERQCMDEELNIYASGFEIPLEQLTDKHSADELVKKIIAYRDVILPPVASV
jgi:hypothetical protein